MNWKFWKKIDNATLKEPEWWRQTLNGNPVNAGVVVTEQTAMQLSAVFAAMRILSEGVSALPLKVYQRRSDGGKDYARNHPLNRLFSGVVNSEMTTQELMEFMMVSAIMRGTAYAQKIRAGNGQIVELQPLASHHMNVDRDASGRLVFDYRQPGQARVFTPDEIWRVPGLGSDGVTGYSILSQAKQSLGVSIATEEHAAKVWANGTKIPAVLETDGTLTDDGIKNLTESLKAYVGSGNAGKTMVLEQGLKYRNIGMTNNDAEFIASRTFQIAEIARWFGVPLHRLSELSRATFSNIEHQGIEFVVHTLRPWCKRFEQTIQRDLITPDNRSRYFAEFTMDALLRGDTKTRYEAHGKAINDGWLTRNEVRSMENRNPEPGLDEFLVPLNMGSATEQRQEPEQEAEGALAQINAKEIAAIRAEHGREDFNAWAEGFYRRIEDKLIADDVDTDTARRWAESRLKEATEADDVLALMNEWETK